VDTVEGCSPEAELGFPEVLRRVPAAFFVTTTEELFEMFSSKK
jgi:hypothetical protein